MATRSLARELALLVLGQVSDQKPTAMADLAMDSVLEKALESLMQHWRESLDSSASELEQAQQTLLESELQADASAAMPTSRDHLRSCLTMAEQVLNGLSASLELPRLLMLGIRSRFVVVRWSASHAFWGSAIALMPSLIR